MSEELRQVDPPPRQRQPHRPRQQQLRPLRHSDARHASEPLSPRPRRRPWCCRVWCLTLRWPRRHSPTCHLHSQIERFRTYRSHLRSGQLLTCQPRPQTANLQPCHPRLPNDHPQPWRPRPWHRPPLPPCCPRPCRLPPTFPSRLCHRSRSSSPAAAGARFGSARVVGFAARRMAFRSPIHPAAAPQRAAPDPHRAASWRVGPKWPVMTPAGFVPKVAQVGFEPGRLKNRLTRPITNISRKAAVSPKPSSMHNRSATTSSGQKQSPPVAIWRQNEIMAKQGRANCRSAKPESRPKSVSDSLLHDLCCDCLQGRGQESPAPGFPRTHSAQAAQHCLPSQAITSDVAPKCIVTHGLLRKDWP